MTETTQDRKKEVRRTAIGIGAIIILSGLWYAFRPERLFINNKVNEAASAEIAAAEPLATGSLASKSDAIPFTGRVSVFSKGGQRIEIENIETKLTGPFVVLISAQDTDSPTVSTKIAEIPSGADHATESLPDGTDASKTRAVFITDQAEKTVYAKATLEPF